MRTPLKLKKKKFGFVPKGEDTNVTSKENLKKQAKKNKAKGKKSAFTAIRKGEFNKFAKKD